MSRIISSAFNKLRSASGFSIMEVLVGVGIASMLLLALGSVLNMAARDTSQFVDRMDADIEILQMEATLRSVLQTAVDVRGVTAAVPPAANERGWIWRNYSSTVGGPLTALGHFFRENRRFTAPANGNSEYWRTGIFFQPPSADGRQSGALFVNLGFPDGGTGNIRADYGSIFLGNIVQLRTLEASMVDSSVAGVNSLTGITFEVTLRTFGGKDFTRPRCFFPVTPSSNPCVTENLTQGTDLVRRFKVTLFNADMGESANTDTPIRERPLGRVYMFPMMSPTRTRFSL